MVSDEHAYIALTTVTQTISLIAGIAIVRPCA